MGVKISIPSGWQRFTHDQEVAEVNGSTVGECLEHLLRKFPGIESEFLDDNGNVFRHVDIYVNGKGAYPEELAKAIWNGVILVESDKYEMVEGKVCFPCVSNTVRRSSLRMSGSNVSLCSERRGLDD